MTNALFAAETLVAPAVWEKLRGPWAELLARQSSTVLDLDVTAGLDWAQVLWETHLTSGPIEVLALHQSGTIQGILPLFRRSKTIRKLPFRGIGLLTELYSGRSGFLLGDQSAELLRESLERICSKTPAWDVFSLTLLEDSPSEKLVEALASTAGFSLQLIEKQYSPYIPFQKNWEQHFAALPKKFRSTIRNGEKRLRDRGQLTYRECLTADDAGQFNSAVLDIERDSWKEAAGTSIAANPVHEAFHRAITVRAAERGFFSGHLLLLDGQPIAYVMGLLYNGVFLDLKESYKNSFRESSPSHVLKNFIFARLYEREAKVFDFMGNCEEYKMKWTDKTYCRNTYLLFNNTLRGRLAARLSSLGRPSPKSNAPVKNEQPLGNESKLNDGEVAEELGRKSDLERSTRTLRS